MIKSICSLHNKLLKRQNKNNDKLFRVKESVGCSCLFEIVKIKENVKVVTYYHKIRRRQHKNK